jgi:two-component system sensor histidine kinase UhpB
MPAEREPDDGPISVEEVFARVRAISRENERILSDLVAGERRFRRLAQAVWRVQEEERRRLARELHDGIGQTLTALKNHLTWLQRQALDGAPSDEIEQAVHLASEALDDTRELSRLLRPPVLDDLGLAPALRWLGRTVSKRFAITVDVEAAEPEVRPARELETVVFRIAQEALTNAAKHAAASRVSVTLAGGPAEIELTVRDDGKGFEVDATLSEVDDRTGIGLRGMRDRVELFGGRLAIRSTPSQGTVLECSLPVPAASPGR